MRRTGIFWLLAIAACGGDPFTAARALDAAADSAPPEDAGPEASVEDAGLDVLEEASDASDARRDDAGEACSPVAHSNGFGGGWVSCEAHGAYSASLAMEACVSYFGADAGVVPCHLATCGSGVLVAQAQNAACITWAYGGSSAGFAAEGTTSGPCVCPTTAGMAWY